MGTFQTKCTLAVFASDNRIKLRPGWLDRLAVRLSGMPSEMAIDEFLNIVVREDAAGKKGAVLVKRLRDRERKLARTVEDTLRGVRRAAAQRKPRRPEMTERLAAHCRAAGRDWARDMRVSDVARSLLGSMDDGGQSAAFDIADSVAPHPSLREACADHVYEGICKVLDSAKRRKAS
jgi:hypothetical protein